MNSFLSIIYPLIWVLVIFLIVRKNNLKKLNDKKIAIMALSFSILLLWIIGLLTKFELLNPIYFGEYGYSISFLGIALLTIISFAINCILEVFRKRY